LGIGALAIGPLALGFIAYASTQVTAAGISLTKKTKFFAIYSWIAALLNLGLNILFVPRWGMMAAGWTTAASYTFITVSYLVTSQRLWPVAYEKWRMLAAIGLTFTFTVAVPLFPEMTLMAGVIFKIIYCLGYVALLFTLQVLDKREWSVLHSLLWRRTSLADISK